MSKKPTKPKMPDKSDNNDAFCQAVRTFLDLQKTVLTDVEKVLKKQDHPLWMLLPDVGLAVDKSQRKILEKAKKHKYGKLIAPSLEISIAAQGKLLDKVVDARNGVRDTGAKLVVSYSAAIDKLLEQVDD